MKIGIIREGKIPHDKRVPLTPAQCKLLSEAPYYFDIKVKPSQHRCFDDQSYVDAGICVADDLSDRDILLGVKEVPIAELMPGKTYFFFSHTIKKQPYNRKLLQAILEKAITLIDYEVLVDDNGQRLIAFGMFAGVVGAYNAFWLLGEKTGSYHWPRLIEVDHYKSTLPIFEQTQLPPVKTVLTGSGRVASGALRVLRDMKIREVDHDTYLNTTHFDEPVFTVVTSKDYVKRIDGRPFDKSDFYAHPESYCSSFEPFLSQSDVFINCIYWDPKAPAFFDINDISGPDFRIRVIADITCDIAPETSVPTTLKPSTIENPVYGVNRFTHEITVPYLPDHIDVMAVDNLPTELPKDASDFFGKQFIQVIIPELQNEDHSDILTRGTITSNGKLMDRFSYLQDYVDGH